MTSYSNYNLIKIRNPELREILETIMDTTAGHDHDGTNSTLVAVEGTVADGAITNAKINASAAIAYSKLNLAGSILNADINASAAIAYSKLSLSNSILNADINSAAAIAWSKLATSTDINTSGQVVDLTISGETNGDVLRFDGTNWTAVDPTALPAGTASILAQSSTIEAGTYDITMATTSQTSGATTLTIPDFAGVNDTYVFATLAQTLNNKTFAQTGLSLRGGDTNACTLKVNETLTGAKTLNVKINDTDRTIDLSGNLTIGGAVSLSGAFSTVGDDAVILNTSAATELTLPTTGTLVTLAGTEELSNKTLVTPVIDDGDAGCTVTSANQTNASAVATIPDIGDAADTFCMIDTAQTLTSKTLTAPVITSPDLTQGVSNHDYSSGHVDWTLSAAEEKTKYLRCTNADAAANILGTGTDGKEFVVQNSSGEAITIKVSGQSGVQIANGKSAMVVGNGTDFVRVTADA